MTCALLSGGTRAYCMRWIEVGKSKLSTSRMLAVISVMLNLIVCRSGTFVACQYVCNYYHRHKYNDSRREGRGWRPSTLRDSMA